MIMEEGSQRSLLRSLQKEQERERRRIRDRQRRQSMSVEEREKHLARRRRNYQLRRQRAETARLDPRFNQKTTVSTTTTTTSSSSSSAFAANINEYQPLISVSDVNVNEQCNGGALSNFTGLEIPAHKLAKLPTRLRLNHLKNLARSLDYPVAITNNNHDNNNHSISVDLIIKGNEIANSTYSGSGMPLKGLRLNRVKRLARSLNSNLEKGTSLNHQSMVEVEKNLPSTEPQLQLLSMSSNLSM